MSAWFKTRARHGPTHCRWRATATFTSSRINSIGNRASTTGRIFARSRITCFG